jgi:hypothetical protein
LALRNAASFYQDGKIVNVEGPELMATAKPYHITPGFAFVAYPNRGKLKFLFSLPLPLLECSLSFGSPIRTIPSHLPDSFQVTMLTFR